MGERSGEVLSHTEDGIGWATINRPGASNAARPETMRALCAALDQLIADNSVRAIVLTGAGRHFMAGGDFGFLESVAHAEGLDTRAELYHWFQGASRRLYECPKPTVAAVAGAAITVGCELALACDVRIADRTAFFQESWLDLGLIPPLGGAMLLPRTVGLGIAKEMILECRRVSAEEALRIGLVSEIAEDAGALKSRAQARARAMAARPSEAFRVAKELIHRGLESSMAHEWSAGVTAQALLLGSADFRQALAARRPGAGRPG